jgi:hypothetical protein
MSTEALGVAAYVVAQHWPLLVLFAFAFIAISGICALFIAAERVHGGPEDESGHVINFEKWRD